MPSHTPEPWEARVSYDVTGYPKIAVQGLARGDADRDEANAVRIVACVNALAGIADPAAALNLARLVLGKVAQMHEGTDAPIGIDALAVLALLGKETT